MRKGGRGGRVEEEEGGEGEERRERETLRLTGCKFKAVLAQFTKSAQQKTQKNTT